MWQQRPLLETCQQDRALPGDGCCACLDQRSLLNGLAWGQLNCYKTEWSPGKRLSASWVRQGAAWMTWLEDSTSWLATATLSFYSPYLKRLWGHQKAGQKEEAALPWERELEQRPSLAHLTSLLHSQAASQLGVCLTCPPGLPAGREPHMWPKDLSVGYGIWDNPKRCWRKRDR
jgi:hypothetical protein